MTSRGGSSFVRLQTINADLRRNDNRNYEITGSTSELIDKSPSTPLPALPRAAKKPNKRLSWLCRKEEQEDAAKPRRRRMSDAIETPREIGDGPEPSAQKTFSMIIVGDRNTGRTEFMHQLALPSRMFRGDGVRRPFDEFRSIDFQKRTEVVDRQRCCVKFWEISHEKTIAMGFEKSFYRKANAIVAVYDVTSSQSFLQIGAWLSVAQAFTPRKVPLFVVGTKSDLAEDRQVDFEAGKEYAAQMDGSFFEVSSKTRSNLEAFFHVLVRALAANTP